MPIDVDNVNQAESFKWVRQIFQNTHGTCFISNFSREIIRNGLKYIRGLLVMQAHRRRQHQLGLQVGTSLFQKQTWHMFDIQLFQKNLMVSNMSEAFKSGSSTLSTS